MSSYLNSRKHVYVYSTHVYYIRHITFMIKIYVSLFLQIALIRGSLMALDYMGKHNGGKGGTIVNMASTAGIISVPHLSVYSASKFAIVTFSRSLEVRYIFYESKKHCYISSTLLL